MPGEQPHPFTERVIPAWGSVRALTLTHRSGRRLATYLPVPLKAPVPMSCSGWGNRFHSPLPGAMDNPKHLCWRSGPPRPPSGRRPLPNHIPRSALPLSLPVIRESSTASEPEDTVARLSTERVRTSHDDTGNLLIPVQRIVHIYISNNAFPDSAGSEGRTRRSNHHAAGGAGRPRRNGRGHGGRRHCDGTAGPTHQRAETTVEDSRQDAPGQRGQPGPGPGIGPGEG